MRKIKSVLIIVISGMLLLTSCTPGKIEERKEGTENSKEFYLVNTSRTEKYQFTVEETQIIHHHDTISINKDNEEYDETDSYTSLYTLNPGEYHHLGKSIYEYNRNEYGHYKCMVSYNYEIVGYLEIKKVEQ